VSKLVLESIKKRSRHFVCLQFVMVAFASLFACVIGGLSAAEALLVGGLIYVVPSACYAARIFSNLSSHAIKQTIVIFYGGELLKLMVTIGAFFLVLHYVDLPLAPYFIGYLIGALSFCIAPLIVTPPVGTQRLV